MLRKMTQSSTKKQTNKFILDLQGSEILDNTNSHLEVILMSIEKLGAELSLVGLFCISSWTVSFKTYLWSLFCKGNKLCRAFLASDNFQGFPFICF